MGYDFTIKKENAWRVKQDGDYPWPPCAKAFPLEQDRTIHLSTRDVLTKSDETGKYMKHTGLGCTNIILKDEEVEPWGQDVKLRLL
ncbi:hypothetical protein [Variovorax paradoxus]|uniref:Uncharacterized protein n=1 Tax=Variovorax paradoxus TaxID=34073 RepID=A0A679JCD5_VARPD|nr:hypothetical protein VVAX_04376 [Variovorax paradoxus]